MNNERLIRSLWKVCILLIVLIAILALIFKDNIERKPILIGFVGQLSGKQAELGVQERNGVEMEIENINMSGGIRGRKIQLIVRDDLGIPDKARSIDHELIKEGVVAIIGHTTTNQTLEGMKITNPAKVVLIGPTISSPQLSNMDDYFFSVYPSFKDSAEAFANYIYKHNCISNMDIIYDNNNTAYSKSYCTVFEEKYKSLGGNIATKVQFSSADKPDFTQLLLNLRQSSAEGLLIVASDSDTALIAQKSRLLCWNVPLFTSAWAQTRTLIINGGKAVEGIEIEQAYDLTSEVYTFSKFMNDYQTRFGYLPSFGASFGYEAAMVLKEALNKTDGSSRGLKQALTGIQNFKGLTDTFSINKFGDVKRPFYLNSVSNGKFIIVDKLASSSVEVKK